MLPARVIETVAEATELNVLSHELDRGLLARLPSADGVFTVAQYCAAYRSPSDRAVRSRQIGLIGEVGAGLDRYVEKPLIRSALAMMRRPAGIAGLSVLHDFLERGFHAFRKMKGATVLAISMARARAPSRLFEGDNAPRGISAGSCSRQRRNSRRTSHFAFPKYLSVLVHFGFDGQASRRSDGSHRADASLPTWERRRARVSELDVVAVPPYD
jgi:hypothetical protein